MMQQELLTRDLKAVGEEISHELGAKMVKDFQDANPTDVTAYYIGRNILEQIMAQPNCAGIRFYNAINELGQKTLVYVGIDSNDNIIRENICIDTNGQLTKEKGIVADRATSGDQPDDGWGWL